LRILAEFSQDPVFLDAYRTGKDLHEETAKQIGVEREVAKTINFGLCYGMSAQGLAERLGITSEDAQNFIAAYFKAYPQVKNTLDQLGFKALSSGYSETPLGRKRYFKPADSFGAQKSLERRGRNAPIQSTCADILKKAISYLTTDLGSIDAKIINLVHDEIVIECAEGQVNEVREIVGQDMVKAGEDFLKSVPVEVDIKIDKVWRK
jgi:DNA polymerase-1